MLSVVESKVDCPDDCCDGYDDTPTADALELGCSNDTTSKAVEPEGDCSKGCCESDGAIAKAMVVESDRPKGCCESDDTTSKAAVAEPSCSDGCCGKVEGHPSVDAPKATCTDSCCGKTMTSGKDVAGIPTSVACSSDATKNAVVTTCRSLSEDTHGESRSTQSNACSNHLSAAFDRFQALLAKSRCICRTVAQEIGVCCCSLAKNGTVARSDVDNSSEAQPGPQPGVSTSVSVLGENASNNNIRQRSTGCCDKSDQPPKVNEVLTPNGCDDGTCGTGCCSSTAKKTTPTQAQLASATTTSSSDDIENAAAREHIVLSVSGMTCTGCSTKLLNVLNQISGISKPQVTFVSGTASFDLDPQSSTADTALLLIERRTGFKISRVVEGHQTLDVLMSIDTAVSFEQSHPSGLVSISKSSKKTKGQKKTYQIAFDPYVIGARDLLRPGISLAPPAPDPSFSEGQKRLINTGWMTAVGAAFTIPVVVLNWAPVPLSRSTIDIVSLILATVVQAIAVPEFYVNAIKSLIFSKVVEMDMLVVISITAAYGYSIVAFGLTEAGYTLEEDAFFETSSLLITLVLLGRLVAAVARTCAISAVSIRSLQVETAVLLGADGVATEIDGRLLQFGDSIVVRPHTRIITDGTVISGVSAVDESMLTGETVPLTKLKGDSVIAGTLNGEGVLHVRLTRLPGANSISDIAKSVDNALSAKPKIQDLADKIASWFVPVAVGVAIIVFVIWIAVVAAVRHENAGSVIGTSITYGIAVLAISCPCALGLAVPMVLVIAGGLAAKSGVIIKAADATERGFKVTDVVFDKTGTLTKGDLLVASEHLMISGITDDMTKAIVRSLVHSDKHPVSRSVLAHVGEEASDAITLHDVKSVPGAGIKAMWNDREVQGGSPFWLGLEEDPVVSQMLDQGMTCFCVAIDGSAVLALGLKSSLRDEATTVVSALQQRGITVHIVSGDHAKAVDGVARSLGVHSEHTASRRLPGQKQQYVASLQDNRKIVMFCGDGTNDAVALAQANIGVQLGTASDVAGAVADVVLLGGLDGTLALMDVSKRAFRRIIFNFAWSAAYNVFAILLASGAFVTFRIPPAYAGLGEIVSVVPVIFAAVSLLWGTTSTA